MLLNQLSVYFSKLCDTITEFVDWLKRDVDEALNPAEFSQVPEQPKEKETKMATNDKIISLRAATEEDKLKGQKAAIVNIVSKAGTITREKLIEKLGKELGDSSRQDPKKVLAFYMGPLQEEGFISVEKEVKVEGDKPAKKKAAVAA